MTQAGPEQVRARLMKRYPELAEAVAAGPAWEQDRRLARALAALMVDPDAAPIPDADAAPIPDADAVRPAEPDGDADEGCTRPAVVERVDAYFAGSLAAAAVEAVLAHVAECPACGARYQALWDQEGGGERRRKRLFRGLPWPAEPEADPGEADEAAHQAAAADRAAEAGRRLFTPQRVAWAVALLLAVVGLVGLMSLDRSEKSPDPPEAPPVLDPDTALTVALFRYDTSGRYEEPWRTVMDSVAADERVMATLSFDTKSPFYLVAVLMDDLDHLVWLAPQGGPKAGHGRGVRLQGPVQAARIPGEVRVPRGGRRLVLYAVVTRRPLPLETLLAALATARQAEDFFTSPPRLSLPGSLQARRAVDVLR